MNPILDTTFKNNLPESLSLNHYELATNYHIGTPDEWRTYLQDNKAFILRETAAITEAEARKALNRLSSGALSTQDVSAIKQLLAQSEDLNRTTNNNHTFISTFIPDPHDPNQNSQPKSKIDLAAEGQEALRLIQHRNLVEKRTRLLTLAFHSDRTTDPDNPIPSQEKKDLFKRDCKKAKLWVDRNGIVQAHPAALKNPSDDLKFYLTQLREQGLEYKDGIDEYIKDNKPPQLQFR